MRFECAKNVNKATDKMMQACGGAGYKKDLGKNTNHSVEDLPLPSEGQVLVEANLR